MNKGKKYIRNRAEFALRYNFGDKLIVDWWILKPKQSWHEAVAGDGCSYTQCEIDSVYQRKNESRSQFKKRVQAISQSIH